MMLTRIVNGETVALTPEEESQVISEWELNLSTFAEEKRVKSIKDEAQARIIAQLPSGEPSNFIIKELNLLMLDNEMNDILLQGGTLTVEQEAQKVFFRGLKDKIKAIRDMSNIAEANGDSTDKFKSDLAAAGL